MCALTQKAYPSSSTSHVVRSSNDNCMGIVGMYKRNTVIYTSIVRITDNHSLPGHQVACWYTRVCSVCVHQMFGTYKCSFRLFTWWDSVKQLNRSLDLVDLATNAFSSIRPVVCYGQHMRVIIK